MTRAPRRICVVGGGIAGAAVFARLTAAGGCHVSLMPGTILGSTHRNQRWLHSGLLYDSAGYARRLWQARQPFTRIREAVVDTDAIFLTRSPEARDSFEAKLAEWRPGEWGLHVSRLGPQRDDQGRRLPAHTSAYQTPDGVYDFPLAVTRLLAEGVAHGGLIHPARTVRAVEDGGAGGVLVDCGDHGPPERHDHVVVAAGAYGLGLVRALGIDPPTVIRRCVTARLSGRLVSRLTVVLDAQPDSAGSTDLSFTPFQGETILAEPDGDVVDAAGEEEVDQARLTRLLAAYGELDDRVGSLPVREARYCYKLEVASTVPFLEFEILGQATSSSFPSWLTFTLPGKATLALAMADRVAREILDRA